MSDEVRLLLSDCGCCEGTGASTPAGIHNRPALDAIAYRVGTHATFKQSMLARLADARWPVLRALRTRDDDDFSIALIDAWATVADVLTFYQERIANEAFLRTATERSSIRELARLIGHELGPGVAASVALAFRLDEPPALPASAAVTAIQPPVRPLKLEAGLKAQSVPGKDEKAQVFETVEPIEARLEWNAIRPRLTELQTLSATMDEVWLEETSLNLAIGDVLLIVSGPAGGDKSAVLHRVTGAEPDVGAGRTKVNLEPASDEETVTSSETGVWAMRVVTAPFGHNAPKEAKYDPPGLFKEFVEWHLDDENTTELTLAARYEKVVKDSWIVIDQDDPSDPDEPRIQTITRATDVTHRSVAKYGIAASVTHLALNPGWVTDTGSDLALLRSMVVYAQSEPLTLAEAPLSGVLPRNDLTLDRSYPGLKAGGKIAVFGTTDDGEPAAEVAEIHAVTDDGDFTILTLEADLEHDYLRTTVTFNANVAAATHGETVREVLGSGEATQTYQSFTLRQPPLTYIGADVPSGAESTLKVYVNDVLWREVPFLYGRSPNDRVYVTRADDQGRTVIRFGDGVTGTRLPTGQNNVRTEYRRGTGVGGLVRRGQVSQLLSRPLGLKEVINPADAEGAEDPETRDQARRNAPPAVLTLDRAVSLRDYEDFARAFAGVAKAQAVWVWGGRKRSVFVTVAGPNGEALDDGGRVVTKLQEALRQAGDPYVPFTVRSYGPVPFRVGGSVTVHPDHVSEKVLSAVKDVLRRAFSFDAREFGQAVALSDVVAVVHTVPGVVAVNITTLYRVDAPSPSWRPRLDANPPLQAADGTLRPAELLLLDEDSLDDLSAGS